MLLVILLATLQGYSQIAVNTTPNNSTCNLNGDTVTASVPTEALTGDNIALNITLPGSYDAGCVKSVSITKSSNLAFQSSGAIPFTDMGGGTYQNTAPPVLAGNDGQNFNVFFKFPNYTTCNGTVGTFDVTVTLDCAGVISTCTTSVTVIARADNYWSISKEFVTGDLTCGISKWRIKLTHNNPNGAGLGTYNINGTITETPSVPIVSGASFLINQNGYTNGTWNKYVTLQNCAPDGTVITNLATYNFTLGDGTCDTMSGSVSATSPPLASPNASISFTKYVSSSYNTNLTPGCDARYQINVCNNGNVPWTNLQISDNLNIPGITVTGMSLGGWTSTPAVPPYPATTYTFDAPPGFILNPGDCQTIFIYFTIDLTATIGSTISNTANLSYVAAGTGGSPGGPPLDPCPLISCPTIDTTIQNTSDDVDFIVEAPKSIPSIKKCIVDPPNALIPPIYQIGDPIKFSIMVGNSGSGDLTDIINDAMGLPGQNLQINTGSITYNYYPNQNTGYKNSCNPPFGAPIPPPFSVVADTSDLQNPFWTITNMPGICDYYKSNFLIIEFEAEILPQLSGSKTNTATIPYGAGTLSSSVNYSIDQVGILGIFKDADEEIVENGQSFNYTITVSNDGSVPLDNIVITDMLPNCVSVNGQINIEDGMSGTVSFSTSSNLIITVNPATQIQPGEDFTITIPVVKSGGGNCCNESVSVTADMTTSGVELNANYGSEEAPAACVTGTECCDIEDFDATIHQNSDNFNVTINGGSVPLQEVEISMVDYHIEYSDDACKPDDLGIFGTLTTSTTNLGDLLLNSGDNGTSSLSWLLGNPSIINNSVNLDILYPDVLNLDCCEVSFYFCLKVRVQDVNCNVCEKIICFSSDDQNEPDPCDIVIEDFNQDTKYCPGDSITLNWSGSTPSGLVNVILFDNTNAVVYGVLASGIANTGTFTYTIPASIPCDPPRSWSIIVEDAEKECSDRSDTFIIECCDQHADCDCGEWKTKTVSIKGFIKEIPQNPTHKINQQQDSGNDTDCGQEVKLKRFQYYSFTAPDYVCNPENCDVSYDWEVVDPNNIIQSGNGKTFNYTFTGYGIYKVIFYPICGGKRCEPCTIYVKIDKLILQDPNNLPHDIPIGLPNGDVYNSCTGKIWMNKNLGASQIATSSSDPAAYGDLYQWGRLTDGHENRTSTTTTTRSTTDAPGHNNFIVNITTLSPPSDWRTSKNNNLWQGVNGINNPCPSGYRIPTYSELEAERLCWNSNGAAGAFASPLKWTLAGSRYYNQVSGIVYSAGSIGKYWTSSPNGYKAQFLMIFPGNAFLSQSLERANGASVRCIKN